MPQFQKYPDPRHESLYRLLCAILRDLDLQHPEQSQYDPATLERLKALSEDDWALLGRMAEAERVAPLIYWAVESSQELRAAFNQQTYTIVQTAYYASAAHNAVLFQELDRILRMLDEADIPVIVLKGAALAQTIYPDIALRPMNDIDLLVLQKDLDQAVSLILASGYRRVIHTLNDNFEIQIAHAAHLAHRKKTGLDVDVHWRLASGEASLFQAPMAWFWQTKETRRSNSDSFDILSSSAHLLYLCAHLGLQHGIGKGVLIWQVDILQLTDKTRKLIDWGEFTRQAKLFGWSAAAYYVLHATLNNLDADITNDVLAQLRSQMQPREENPIRVRSMAGQNNALGGLIFLTELKGKARIKSLFANLFPSPKFMRKRYRVRSNWVLPFYYLYRWWDMCIKLVEAFRLIWISKSPR